MFHKGLLSNLVFVVLMVAGVALIETQYPQEGPRGFDPNSNNSDVKCVLNTTCVVFRIIRSVGVFGFFGESVSLADACHGN